MKWYAGVLIKKTDYKKLFLGNELELIAYPESKGSPQEQQSFCLAALVFVLTNA